MPVDILGIQVDPVTLPETLTHIDHFIDQGKPHQIVTVNPEFVMRAQSDDAFQKVLNHADLAIPDGAGLLWASRVLAWRGRNTRHQPMILKERVTGTDLLPALAMIGEKKHWKFYLLGGQPGVAERAATVLTDMFPDALIVGTESGPLVNEAGKPLNRTQEGLLDAVMDRIRHTKPDILFVAFGAPKQDRFIARFKHELKVPVMIGVGGAFDFLAGNAKRAPKLFQILWIEWLWRLFVEPWRIGRIFTAVVRFPLAVLLSKYS